MVFVYVILHGASRGEGTFAVPVSQFCTEHVVYLGLGSEEVPEKFFLLLSKSSVKVNVKM